MFKIVIVKITNSCLEYKVASMYESSVLEDIV